METFRSILEWLIPSGSLATVVVWLTSKTIRNLKKTEAVHDTYKKLYDDLKGTLIELQDEINRLYKETNRLRQAVTKASTCIHYRDCPIKYELLREQEGDTKPKGRKRQRSNQGGQANGIRADPDVESTIGDSG
ncbi:hypothetical protein FACS189451_12200 [Bacteroidia bacterium]|nr:hypothetical protein FACS189451_12200 [Bacteroidia bacterium]